MASYKSPKATLEAAGTAPIGGGHGLQGTVREKRATVTLSSAAAQNDTLDFFTMPKGAQFVDAYVVADELDTNGSATGTLDIGNSGGDTDLLFDGADLGAAKAINRSWNVAAASGYVWQEDTLIQGVVPTAVATGATGSVELVMLYKQVDFATS